jgi:GNAT superfamily N-acetyltransferase
MEEKKRIDPRQNPFFGHGSVQLYLAYKDGVPAGRIAAIENTLHNEFHEDRVGFFGMFESIEDREVAGALIEQAAEWVREKGLEVMRGPTNFSTNEECGLLVDGFDDAPYVMMTYNPPYYAELLESHGFKKAKDLLALEGSEEVIDQRRFTLLERSIKRSGLEFHIRPLDMKNFNAEVSLVRDLYNAVWERNWGFVPMTDKEVDHMAAQLKPVVDPELALIGEVNGEPVGFALALPDVNQAIRHANGKLFPFGIIKLLWHMRRINGVRVITLGVKKEYRGTPLAPLFYKEIFERGTTKGHDHGESSWILEDNLPMISAVEKMGFKRTKTYRLYDLPLS